MFLGVWAATATAAEDSDLFGGDADAQSPAAKKNYRKAIKDGVSEYEAHHFEEALSYFRRAHQIYPNARTFRGIGMASFELRDYVTAVRSLTAAVEDQHKPLSAEQRSETEDLIERCRLFVAVYSLQISPSAAQVTIDANPLELEPDGKLMLGLGEHTVEARLKGYRTRTLKVQVRGGERKELELTLDPLTAAVPRRSSGVVLAPKKDPIEPAPASEISPSSLWWFIAGGVAAGAAAGSGVWWGMRAAELSKCRHEAPEGYTCGDEPLLATYRNLAVAGTVVAGAAAVTFMTIGIVQRRAELNRGRKSDIACVPGLFGVACAGRF